MATVRSQVPSAATISENIEALAGNRQLMSKNIIKQLRDLTERVIVRAHTKSDTTTYDLDAIKAGTAWIGSSGKKFNFLHKFHKLLQQSESHYTFDGDVSEQLERCVSQRSTPFAGTAMISATKGSSKESASSRDSSPASTAPLSVRWTTGLRQHPVAGDAHSIVLSA